jgi:hypothetical protein
MYYLISCLLLIKERQEQQDNDVAEEKRSGQQGKVNGGEDGGNDDDGGPIPPAPAKRGSQADSRRLPEQGSSSLSGETPSKAGRTVGAKKGGRRRREAAAVAGGRWGRRGPDSAEERADLTSSASSLSSSYPVLPRIGQSFQVLSCQKKGYTRFPVMCCRS